MPRQRSARRSGRRHLPIDFRGDAFGQPPAGRDQHGARIRIVFGLREQIGRNPVRRARRRDDQDLRRSGVEIDAAVGGDE